MKQNIENHEPHYKPGVSTDARKGKQLLFH